MEKVINNITFNEKTPDKIVSFILNNLNNGERFVFEYGDINTGQHWGDIISGSLGNSTGTSKIPLLIKTKRSFGGEALLCDCIVSIKTAKGKRIIYQHETYKPCK